MPTPAPRGPISTAMPVRVADTFGRLLAQGLIGRGEALSAMLHGSEARGSRMDPSGRQARLAWALDDSAARWARARDVARFGIRRALGPLLATRAPSAALLTAARAVNDEGGGPLTDREVLGMVRAEIYWAARRLQREAKAMRA